MSTKGKEVTFQTRYKIAIAKQKDRKELQAKLTEYLTIVTDPKERGQIPSIVSASLYAGISKKALLEWELSTGENSEIRQTLDFIRDLEEKWLREMGLLKLADGKLVTTLLKAEHGVKEEPTQLTQNNNFNISPEILAEALQLSRTTKK